LRLDVTRIYTHITLRSMAALIDETLGSAPSGEPCGIRPVEVWGNGHGYPVFVMVGGAGSVEEYTKYHRIGEQLGEGYRLMILPDPDTASGGFPTRDLSTLADAYARFIRSDLPGGPVILLGDCIGGIDAYATACALQRLGVDDVAVVMLDTTAPGYLSRMSAAVSVRRKLEAMPARAGRLSECIAGSYLWLHRLTGIGRWYYRAPGSRRQLMQMALAWGLFSGGSDTSNQGKAGQKLARERMEIYLAEGWKDRQPPASGFNAARYRKQVPVFDPGQDDPVSHALLLGMKGGYVRRRLMDQMREPVGKSDIMAARTWLRREDFRPERFKGRVLLILSERIFARGGMRGWERHVDGIIEVRKGRGDHRSYLREHVRETALVIRRSIGKLLNNDPSVKISAGNGDRIPDR
jgi:thioesterase domain-containing protein